MTFCQVHESPKLSQHMFILALALQDFCLILYCLHEFILGGDLWRIVEELDSIAQSLTLCCFCVAGVSAIVFGGGKEIPAVDGVVRPCSPLVSRLMNLDLAAHWRQWHFVVVKRSTEMGVGRDSWRCIGLPQKIERDFCLR